MLKSIKYKIMLGSGISTAAALIIILIISLQSIHEQSHEAASEKLLNISYDAANMVHMEIDRALDAARTLAHSLTAIKSSRINLNRAEVNAMLKQVLSENPGFLAVYTLWEPNEFDNMDAQYVNAAGHDATGRFIPYWARSNDNIILEPLVDYEKEGAGDYYLIPKRTGREAIIEPYLYPVNGREILITSLVVPISVNGKFYGICGVDLPLGFLQQLADKIHVYNEAGKLNIQSNTGIISGFTGQLNLVGKKVSEAFAGTDMEQLLNNSEYEGVNSSGEYIASSIPIYIGKTDTPWLVNLIVPLDEVNKTANELFRNMLIIALVLLTASMIILWYISKRLAKPITDLSIAADKLASGDVNFNIRSTSKDEIGILENSFNLMINNIKAQAVAAEKIAQGNIDVGLMPKSENDILSKSMIKVANTVRGLVSETVMLSNAAVEGKLTVRGSIDKFEGGYKEIIKGFNETLNAVIQPIKEGSEVLKVLSTGDLTARMEGEYRGDYRIVKDSINKLADSMNDALQDVVNAAEATASAARQISASSEEMAAGSQQLNQQTGEVASAVEEMTTTILQTSKNASTASDNSILASENAKKGARIVEETRKGMFKIVDSTKETGVKITSLANKTDQIGEIAQTIDEIADQTNLLALNAAIEAARAGEQGRGFAVVADEVRKLAERTTKATKEIAETIKSIQSEAKEADTAMASTENAVENGMAMTEQVADSLKQILIVNQKVSDMINQVAAGSEQQSNTAEHISQNIESISNVTTQNAAGTEQIARAAEDLNNLTVNLLNLISKFKLHKQGNQLSTCSVRQNGKLSLQVQSL